MKTRILSSLAGLGVLAVALILLDTILFQILLFFICALAILELLSAAGLQKFRGLVAICLLFCLALLFQGMWPVQIHFARICMVYISALFLYQLAHHQTLRVEQLCYTVCMTILITMSFYCMVLIKERVGAQLTVFYLFMALGSAWWSDSGAYFVGTFFGKTKLCPGISPKKTVEGLVGGLVTAVLGNLLVCGIYLLISNWLVPLGYFTHHVAINLWSVVLLTPLLSVLGVLGDLSASVIKRQYDIKDFGNIMPGHGGIMDRFDSVLFIIPAIFMIFNILPLISVI